MDLQLKMAGYEGQEKTKVLDAFFASVFTGKTMLQESQASETGREVWREVGK